MTYSSICRYIARCSTYAPTKQSGTVCDDMDGIEYIADRSSMPAAYIVHDSLATYGPLETSLQEYKEYAVRLSSSLQTKESVYPMCDQVSMSYALTPDYSTDMIIARPDHFDPGILLRADRPAAPFVGAASVVQAYVQDLFSIVTGHMMDPGVTIEIVSKEELCRAHEDFGGTWSEGIQGFCINKKGKGQSLIMVREGALDSVLLTIGHEIGHSRSVALQSTLDEEAKAFAFQMEWARAIIENDVAGLARSIELSPRPARNGLHDVACLFVERERRKGLKALDIFTKLIRGDLQVAG